MDMYLQANMSSDAIEFYTKAGFKKMHSNNVEELPEKWQEIVNDKTEPKFYI